MKMYYRIGKKSEAASFRYMMFMCPITGAGVYEFDIKGFS